MGKINILSNTLANKIAAGEVVERPASVVKELLENSIDANSTNIKIIISEFGIKEIRIIDNGSGIANDDIEKAFMRHATSKISSDYDLFHINTLGFRGEALASIASVSEIEVKSCSDGKQGKILEIVAGRIVKNDYYAAIQGTDISVKNLFFNTPARLKYLRNKNTEQAAIVSIVNKLALSYPNISFELIVDDKILLKTFGDGDTKKIISKIYNLHVAKNMLEFSANNDDYKIQGYISKPEETRANKNYINIFVNGRYIKNYLIQNTIITAYDTFLMKNRYPIAVLNIEMDPVLLDVNVHPTKQEVRLSKEEDLLTLIRETISRRLSDNTYIPDAVNTIHKVSKKEETSQLSFATELDNKYEFKEKFSENFKDSSKIEEGQIEYKKNISKEISNFNDFVGIDDEQDVDNVNQELHSVVSKSDISNEINGKTLPQLRVLAQIFKTYILAESGSELYLIDQHAAQERYNYERLKKVFSSTEASKQLLLPIVLNLSSDEMAHIKTIEEKLNELHIKIEEFGINSYILREYPIWIEKEEVKVIEDIIEKIKMNRNITIEELRHDSIAMASCKASLKANQVLNYSEMEKVLEDLYTCQNPFTCPHGRPIMNKMTKQDIEKIFKRIV